MCSALCATLECSIGKRPQGAWKPRQGSNLRMGESKSPAFPLGYGAGSQSSAINAKVATVAKTAHRMVISFGTKTASTITTAQAGKITIPIINYSCDLITVANITTVQFTAKQIAVYFVGTSANAPAVTSQLKQIAARIIVDYFCGLPFGQFQGVKLTRASGVSSGLSHFPLNRTPRSSM